MHNETHLLPGSERRPNPSFDTCALQKEIDACRARNADGLRKSLEDDDQSPEMLRWLKEFHNEITTASDEKIEWLLLHEFHSLLPGGHIRSTRAVPEGLLRDLDRLLAEQCPIQRYVELRERASDLTALERRGVLTSSQEEESRSIQEELGKIDLGCLYIGMRQLGYRPEELSVNKKGKK